MSLGPPGFKQHVVEFILGTGAVTDGVADSTTTTGPWTWVVPGGVAEIRMDGCSAGLAGAGGGLLSTNTSLGGGAGGASGMCVHGVNLAVQPKSSLTVTLGQSVTGKAAGADCSETSAQYTTVTGLLPVSNGTSIVLRSDEYSQNGSASASTFAVGGGSSGWIGSGMSGGNSSGSGGDDISADFSRIPEFLSTQIYLTNGAGGGAGAFPGSGSGGNGGGTSSGPTASWYGGLKISGGSGDTTGTVSRGGGGAGANSLFGTGGTGGNGGVAGGNASGYGSGGGGGGGGAAGGNSGPGYVRFIYWSEK